MLPASSSLPQFLNSDEPPGSNAEHHAAQKSLLLGGGQLRTLRSREFFMKASTGIAQSFNRHRLMQGWIGRPCECFSSPATLQMCGVLGPSELGAERLRGSAGDGGRFAAASVTSGSASMPRSLFASGVGSGSRQALLLQ